MTSATASNTETAPPAGATATQPEKHVFQAEVQQLLDLMIHAIYSNKDIFLRELISNASDALDKRRLASLQEASIGHSADETPHILLTADATARTLTIADNGIGMNRQEVIDLIGTIAKSGTKSLIQNLKSAHDQDPAAPLPPDLIGQFGVGFYATFMVAHKVQLISRKAGDPAESATLWESEGNGAYTVASTTLDKPGTQLTLFLKPEDAEDGLNDYTDTWTLKGIVKQYSDFVAYPILMDVEHHDVERDADGKPVENGKTITTTERETLNSMKAIWLRPEAEVTTEELAHFYKHLSGDWTDPAKTIRVSMEGNFEAKALLFIPAKAPMDLYYRDGKHGLHLYVKRVFIMDQCDALMPPYLRFIKGVVDSEDLSLNISREILQQDRQIQAIRKRLVKKVLESLTQMAENEVDAYSAFWQSFGRVLKEGLAEDREHRDTLLALLRVASTHHASDLTSLKAYISRMPTSQEAIYYMVGDDRKVLENAPQLEAFKAKNIEVLLLTDPVDEFWLQSVWDFDGKKFQSVAKGDVVVGDKAEHEAQAEALKSQESTHKSLLDTLKAKLTEQIGDELAEVKLSNRLTESAACLVGSPGDLSPQMEQLMRAMNQPVPKAKRTLELNPNHPLFAKLQAMLEADANHPKLADTAYLLYGQALLAEGGSIPDPARFSRLLADLMAQTV
jgi:molecular chaperone HtpG